MTKRRYEIETGLDASSLFCEEELGQVLSGDYIQYGDFGHRLKMSGIMFQGEGLNLVFLFPTTGGGTKGTEFKFVATKITFEQWAQILKQTDDPVFFADYDRLNPKAIIRKQQCAVSGAVQQRVWHRDGYRCMFCGRSIPDVTLTVDHFVPVEAGGSSMASNLLSACRACNKRKGSIEPERFCDEQGLDYGGLRMFLDGKCSAAFIAHLSGACGQ